MKQSLPRLEFAGGHDSESDKWRSEEEEGKESILHFLSFIPDAVYMATGYKDEL